MNYSSTFLQYFTSYLSLYVLGAFLVRAIVLSHGFSPALFKIAEKTPQDSKIVYSCSAFLQSGI